MRYQINRTARLTERRVIKLEAAKQSLEVTHSDDDTRIAELIDAATDIIETQLNCAAIETSYAGRFAGWPQQIKRWPVTSITKIEYYDADETLQQFTDYDFFPNDEGPAEICLKADKTWPPLGKTGYPVRIEFEAGYTATNTPKRLQQAVKLLVRHWYDNPSPVVVGMITANMQKSLDSILKSLNAGSVPGVT